MPRFTGTLKFVAEDMAEARTLMFELLSSLGDEITHWMIDADVQEDTVDDA